MPESLGKPCLGPSEDLEKMKGLGFVPAVGVEPALWICAFPIVLFVCPLLGILPNHLDVRHPIPVQFP